MKIRKAIVWVFLCGIWNLSAQNNYSVDFMINSQPNENLNLQEVHIGGSFEKTLYSKLKIENKLSFNSKTVDYNTVHFSNALETYNDLRNQLRFSYLKDVKKEINLIFEPFIASETNLKLSDIDVLAELNVDFKWSSNKNLKIGLSRNTIFGKPMILPVFAFDYEYSKNKSLTIGFPESRIKYSNNSRNVFAITNTFNGSVYNLNTISNSLALKATKSSFSQQTLALEYERNLDTNWYAVFKGGYDFNKKYLLLDTNYNSSYDFNINDGYNFGLTIKYKH